jgi:hypothetical protein
MIEITAHDLYIVKGLGGLSTQEPDPHSPATTLSQHGQAVSSVRHGPAASGMGERPRRRAASGRQ